MYVHKTNRQYESSGGWTHQWAIINFNVGCVQLEKPLTLSNTFCFASKSTASGQGVLPKGGRGGSMGSTHIMYGN
jgi:hypothetical protein